MKLSFLTLLLVFTFFSLPTQAQLTNSEIEQLSRLPETEIKKQLGALLSRGHQSLGYSQARKVIFEKIDNEDGGVCCVYSTDYCLKTRGMPSHKIMNVEHTWPQSHGATGTAKSDLHHLFPTQSRLNSTRSNFPFCEVAQVKFEGDGSKMGHNRNGDICFEPPEDHKGDTARAMFYFAIRYNFNLTKDQEDVLKKWHKQDPVDEKELARHENIVRHQHNKNLFVLNPELVDLISDI